MSPPLRMILGALLCGAIVALAYYWTRSRAAAARRDATQGATPYLQAGEPAAYVQRRRAGNLPPPNAPSPDARVRCPGHRCRRAADCGTPQVCPLYFRRQEGL